MRKFTKEISMLIASVTAGTMACASVNAVTQADPGNCGGDTICENQPIQLSGQVTMPDVAKTEPEVLQRTAGVAVMHPEETEAVTKMPASPGFMMLDDTETPEITDDPVPVTTSEEMFKTAGDMMPPDYTETEEPYPVAGGFPVPDYLVTEEELIPEAGEAMPPEFTTPAVTTVPEELLPEAGVAMPDDITTPPVTTVQENLIATAGVAMRPDGDLDGNGKVDVTDLTELSLYLVGDRKLDQYQLDMADMNYDGKTDIVDLATLKQKIAKK